MSKRVAVPASLEPHSELAVPKDGALRVRTKDGHTYWIKEFARTDSALVITASAKAQVLKKPPKWTEGEKVTIPSPLPYAVPWQSIKSVERIEPALSWPRTIFLGLGIVALVGVVAALAIATFGGVSAE
jgi:hypothetical protein